VSRPSNVVSLPLRTMLLASIRSLTPRTDDEVAEGTEIQVTDAQPVAATGMVAEFSAAATGTVAEFPVARVRLPARALQTRSIDWARGIVAEDRRLSYAVVDTRKRLHRMVRETLPRPTFKPRGAGYEHVTLMMARQILTFRSRNLGVEESKLAESVVAYDDARAQWEQSRRQLAVTSGLDSLVSQWTAVRQNAREAYAILREAGIDPQHP
jgi:hypothetical protein